MAFLKDLAGSMGLPMRSPISHCSINWFC